MNKQFGETKRRIKGEGWRNRVMTTYLNTYAVTHAKELLLLAYILIIFRPQTGVAWARCSSCFEMSFATCDLLNLYLKPNEIIQPFCRWGLTHLRTSDHVRDSGQLWRVYVSLRLIWYVLSVVCEYICMSFYSYINQAFVIVWKLPTIHFCFCNALCIALSLRSAEVTCFSSAGNIFSYKRTLPAVWRRRGFSKLQSLGHNCLFQKPLKLRHSPEWTCTNRACGRKPLKQYTAQSTVYLVTNP